MRNVWIILAIFSSRLIVILQQSIASIFVDKREFGEASLSFAILQIALPLLSLSFAEIAFRYAYSQSDRNVAYENYNSLLSRTLSLSFILFVLFGVFLHFLDYDFYPVFQNVSYIYINFWFVQVVAAYRAVHGDSEYARSLVGYSVISVLALLILLGVGLGYEALPVSAVIALVLSFFFRNVRQVFKDVCKSLSQHSSIRYGKVLRDVGLVSLTNVVSQAYLYADVFVAGYIFNAAIVADLRIASLLTSMATMLSVMFFSYFAPRIAAEKYFRNVNVYYVFYLKMAVPFLVTLSLGVFTVGDYFVGVVYGQEYTATGGLLKWYTLVVVAHLLVRAPVGNILALQGHYRFNLLLSACLLPAMILLQLYLSRLLGVAGMPLSALLVAVVAGSISLGYYRKQVRLG